MWLTTFAAKVVRVPPSIHRTEAGTPRARAPKACNECHAHKTRCTSEHPRCRRCKSMNLECVYEKSKRKSASASASRSIATPTRVGTASQSLALPTEQSIKVEQSTEPNQLASPSVSASSFTDRNRGLSSTQNLLVEYAAQSYILTSHDSYNIQTHCSFPSNNTQRYPRSKSHRHQSFPYVVQNMGARTAHQFLAREVNIRRDRRESTQSKHRQNRLCYYHSLSQPWTEETTLLCGNVRRRCRKIHSSEYGRVPQGERS